MNPSETQAIECTFSFPLDEKSVLNSFTAEFDGNVINTKVQPKRTAATKFDDAIAAGRVAVMGER